MKSTFLTILIFLALLSTKANSQNCNWLPNGVTQTPAWQNDVVTVYISYNCRVTFEYCFRINSNGEKEVVIGRHRIHGTTPADIQTTCLNEYLLKKEMIFDRAISLIVNTANIFGEPSTPPCPNTTGSFFNVYAASCISQPFFDWDQNDGFLVQMPCSQYGYCKYEYKYCYDIVEGTPKSKFQKTLVLGNGVQCPGSYVYPPTNTSYNCFPKDCYPTRSIIFTPTETDIFNIDLNDVLFYGSDPY